MVLESTIGDDDGKMYYRHTKINLNLPTLLFIHGLGDSGLSFIEAFKKSELRGFNIVIPDLLGFGKSTDAADKDYCFAKQIERIWNLIDQIGVNYVYLVGHSMGGDIGTLMCEKFPNRVRAFVNVEGDLTPGDRFITESAVKADKNGRFEEWFRDDLCETMVLEWAHDWPSCLRYLLSLGMCRREAFLESSYEIYSLNEALPSNKVGIIGDMYQKLTVQKVYCWGKESLSSASQQFVSEYNILNRRFDNSFHWVMLDRTEEFYSFLFGFLCGHQLAS